MSIKPILGAVFASFACVSFAFADANAKAKTGVTITDAYARASSPTAKAGAAFMIIENTSDKTDRLLSVRSDASARVELHTHIDAGDGVMQMREIEGGFEIPAGGSHHLQRGGDHVMFMGLSRPFLQGGTVDVTLTFENAGDIVVEIPIDLERKAAHGHEGHGDHGHDHNHDHDDHSKHSGHDH